MSKMAAVASSFIKSRGSLCLPRFTSTWSKSARGVLQEGLDAISKAGTWKSERVISTPQAASIRVVGGGAGGGELLNFCANNYLGLSSHPDVIEAGRIALRDYGAGLSSVRFICGTQTIHKELEQKIAKFHNRDDAILYAACFDANAGIFEALLGENDAVFSDQLNHASIIDGLRLCKARKYRYKNRDVTQLEEQLSEVGDTARLKMIVTDGVFSMDGVVAPLKELCDLGDKYGALVFVDECHATGFMGKGGRGTEEHLSCEGRVDIINSTLGKALGGAAGGYTVGPREVIDMLRQKSRPYLFSNTLPPPVVACASKVFDLLMDGSELVEKLQWNTSYFRGKMTSAGFNLKGDDCHPIVPVMLNDARLATEFADRMLQKGIYVIGFSYPVVPVGEARIRVQLSAVHNKEDIDKCVDAFVSVAKEKGVL
ncbi:PREDICTED: 2-amino-3-ketobutyrate coenzyme A ligase, mitochondrial-like [Amphimedon queenslandica]|uniref:2-amino-3-ketobutyrate coenzyme A ligase, mitochondrial n=1 Tax=Amphimedon queenslandica TaxID=400682 RepID=A0A1X7U4Y9_AMPQE|nr:PREDICTED: 2-amino-3-ketobutyrate coenzyme A ligase, mitochondrial-like [Amphimedon queenslandica]|eukprot:XP_003389035.2 PREDICTED: 2-amino-3-ketobutyrate coenzyme A ligase, mitochondrial-like [Amphimedon queenslandica]